MPSWITIFKYGNSQLMKILGMYLSQNSLHCHFVSRDSPTHAAQPQNKRSFFTLDVHVDWSK